MRSLATRILSVIPTISSPIAIAASSATLVPVRGSRLLGAVDERLDGDRRSEARVVLDRLGGGALSGWTA